MKTRHLKGKDQSNTLLSPLKCQPSRVCLQNVKWTMKSCRPSGLDLFRIFFCEERKHLEVEGLFQTGRHANGFAEMKHLHTLFFFNV